MIPSNYVMMGGRRLSIAKKNRQRRNTLQIPTKLACSILLRCPRPTKWTGKYIEDKSAKKEKGKCAEAYTEAKQDKRILKQKKRWIQIQGKCPVDHGREDNKIEKFYTLGARISS